MDYFRKKNIVPNNANKDEMIRELAKDKAFNQQFEAPDFFQERKA